MQGKHLKLIRLVGSLPLKEQISASSVEPTQQRVCGVNLRLSFTSVYSAVSCVVLLVSHVMDTGKGLGAVCKMHCRHND